MSSTASELNALGATTTMDIYKRSIVTKGTQYHYLLSSKAIHSHFGEYLLYFLLPMPLYLRI
jgi:solute:Na+ symporter, SSS family